MGELNDRRRHQVHQRQRRASGHDHDLRRRRERTATRFAESNCWGRKRDALGTDARRSVSSVEQDGMQHPLQSNRRNQMELIDHYASATPVVIGTAAGCGGPAAATTTRAGGRYGILISTPGFHLGWGPRSPSSEFSRAVRRPVAMAPEPAPLLLVFSFFNPLPATSLDRLGLEVIR
jgi:hypothetical protein